MQGALSTKIEWKGLLASPSLRTITSATVIIKKLQSMVKNVANSPVIELLSMDLWYFFTFDVLRHQLLRIILELYV